MVSGQIIIFHQPRFLWNKRFPLLNHHLGWGRVRSSPGFTTPQIHLLPWWFWKFGFHFHMMPTTLCRGIASGSAICGNQWYDEYWRMIWCDYVSVVDLWRAKICVCALLELKISYRQIDKLRLAATLKKTSRQRTGSNLCGNFPEESLSTDWSLGSWDLHLPHGITWSSRTRNLRLL